MDESVKSAKLPALIRYPVAVALALLAARLLLMVADDVGLLRTIGELPLEATVEYIFERIALCALLVVPALYITDWLLKSRSQSILIGFVATIVAIWLWAA
jgi:hypothetical protein